MKDTISRRKILGAIGGATLLAGCGTSVENSGKTSQGITYKGYHESSDPGFEINRTGHEVGPSNCGVVYTAVVSVGGGTGWRTTIELVAYLYKDGILVARSVEDIGEVGGKDDYAIQHIADEGTACDHIDSFKLAVHKT